MAKPSRSPAGGSSRARGAAARKAPRRAAQARPSKGRGRRRAGGGARPLIGWGRRTGIVLALLVLGTSIVLAGQALSPPRDGGGGAGPPAGSPAQASATIAIPASPAIEMPAEALVAATTAEISVLIPAGVPRDGSHQLRIYVNGELRRERRLPAVDRVVVRAVPLEQGLNSVAAAIAGPAGESLHSQSVELVRDDVPPSLRVAEPQAGDVVHAAQATVRGRSEAGARLTVRNEATGADFAGAADTEGRFSLSVPLAQGTNRLVVEAFDGAGNSTRHRLSVRHEEGAASVELTLSRNELNLAGLPGLVTLRAGIADELGRPAHGAQVTFSLSVPGQSTVTHRATSEDGVAAWHGARIPRDGTLAGQGYATVLVVLPSGRNLQDSVRFEVR